MTLSNKILFVFQAQPNGGLFTYLKDEAATCDHPHVLLLGQIRKIQKSYVIFQEYAYL